MSGEAGTQHAGDGRRRGHARRCARAGLALALAVAACGVSACTRAMFNPVSGPPLSEQETHAAHRAVRFGTADGFRLEGWFMPVARDARGTVVFADGAENVRHHIDTVDWLPDAGYNVLLFNYRGYGRSQGEPTMAGFHRDLRAAIRKADAIDALPRERLVVFGQSLGGAVATVTLANLPRGQRIGALVVDSAPSDYRTIVRETLAASWYTWPLQAPLSWLITDSYQAREAAGRLPPVPKLWIANAGDRTVSAHHTVLLYERASAPSALWRIPPRAHMATLDDRPAREAFARWLDRALDTRRAQPPPETRTRSADTASPDGGVERHRATSGTGLR